MNWPVELMIKSQVSYLKKVSDLLINYFRITFLTYF